VFTAREASRRPAPWFTVVGVVGNVKLASLDEKDVSARLHPACTRLPGTRLPDGNLGVLVRGTGDRAMLSRAVPREIQSVDPNLPVSPIVEMTELMRDGVGDRRFRGIVASVLRRGGAIADEYRSVRRSVVCDLCAAKRKSAFDPRWERRAANWCKWFCARAWFRFLAGLAVGGGRCRAFSGHLLAALLFEVRLHRRERLRGGRESRWWRSAFWPTTCRARRAGRVDPITGLANRITM